MSKAPAGSPRTEIVVGVVGRAHGVRGDVSVDLRTDEPDRRFVVGAVLAEEDGPRRLTVAAVRSHSGRTLVRFEETADRTAAEALRGIRLTTTVPVDERPADAEEYYDRQLVGLRVLDAAGVAVGTVRSVVHLPAQDLLEVDTPAGVRLVPFVAQLVPVVDLDAGHVGLADVPGLLDEPD